MHLRDLSRRRLNWTYEPSKDREELPDPPKRTPAENKLVEDLVELSYLKSFGKARIDVAKKYFTKRAVKAGDVIYKQGARSERYYMIASGEFKRYWEEDDESEETCKGTFEHDFGVMAIYFQDFCEETVRAETDGELWEIDCKLLNRILVKLACEKSCRHYWFLRSVDMLQLLEEHECVRLSRAMETKEVEEDEIIIAQGDRAEGLYFIEKGRVKVEVDGVEVDQLIKKDQFGELALLTIEPAKATVTALEPCVLAFLSSVTYNRVMGSLYEVVSKRWPESWKRLAKKKLGTAYPDEKIMRRGKYPY